jgi:lipoprotein-anchoring transpeptidase ErfK/SrfK
MTHNVRTMRLPVIAALLMAGTVLSACAQTARIASDAPAAAAATASASAPVETQVTETAVPVSEPVVQVVAAHPTGIVPVVDTPSFRDKPRREQPTFTAHGLRDAVGAHVGGLLSEEIKGGYDLFIYVSKANKGPIAQHAYFFAKDASGGLVPGRVWAVSTGRESKSEMSKGGYRVNTSTPAGVYRFDLGRFTKLHKSRQWAADMPYAMFFSAPGRPNEGGFALHAAGSGAIWKLGKRASAGCIRLHPDNAKAMFNELLASYRGQVNIMVPGESTFRPVFQRDPISGQMFLEDGIRAVLIVEDNDGAVLAAEAERARQQAAAADMRQAAATP